MKNSTRIYLGVVLYAFVMAKYGFAARNTAVTFQSVSAGYGAVYTVLSDKTVAAFGYNYSGQLGNGAVITNNYYDPPQTTLSRVVGLTNVKKVKGGDFHACAIFGRGNTGKVACWGDNKYGALGDGTDTSSSIPVEVPGITDAVDLALGGMSTCVLRATKKVVCFGYGGEGQTGRGTLDYYNAPLEVPGLSGITQIAMSAEHVLAIADTGFVYGWGYNGKGEIGGLMNSTIYSQPAPVSYFFSAPSLPIQLAAMNGYSCALLASKQIACWGNGSLAAINSQYSNISQISGYGWSFEVLDTAGNVKTQDINPYYSGVLPAARPNLSPAKTIAAGNDIACSIKTNGALVCEGDLSISLSSF